MRRPYPSGRDGATRARRAAGLAGNRRYALSCRRSTDTLARQRRRPTIDTLDSIVERLVAARAPGSPRVATDAPLPEGIDGAYRVQAGVAARLGPVGAFKCGRPSPDGPLKLAPVSAADVRADGADVAPSASGLRLVELEIAFRLRAEPPVPDDADFESRLRGCVEVLPALEIVDSRLRDFSAADEAWQLADNQNNGAVVTGTRFDAVDERRLDARDVRLEIGGHEIHAGTVTVPGGDAFATFTAFARRVGMHCGGLHEGHVCITGALTGLHPVGPGERVHGTIEGLGTVSARFDRDAASAGQAKPPADAS